MNKYSYKGTIIEAETKEDAIREICGMSFEKKVAENKIEAQSDNVIMWWCLCDYLSKYEDVNGLLHHEQGKLKGVMKKLGEIDFKDMNSVNARKEFLTSLWKENGWDYNTKPKKIITRFEDKFEREKIKEDKNVYMDIANDFINEIDILIDIISRGDEDEIAEYVKRRF